MGTLWDKFLDDLERDTNRQGERLADVSPRKLLQLFFEWLSDQYYKGNSIF